MATQSSFVDDEEKDDLSVYVKEGKGEAKEADKVIIRPADHGRHAWLFLCASFLIEGLALGMLHMAMLVTLPLKSSLLVLTC